MLVKVSFKAAWLPERIPAPKSTQGMRRNGLEFISLAAEIEDAEVRNESRASSGRLDDKFDPSAF